MHSRNAASQLFSPVPTTSCAGVDITADAPAASNAARCARTSSANVAAAVSVSVDDLDANPEPNCEDLFSTVVVSTTGSAVVTVVVSVVVDVVEVDVVDGLVEIVIVGMRLAAWVGRVADTRFADADGR